MNLEPESFVNNNTQNFTSVQFVIVEDGLLEITPITDEVTVTINGNTATEVYNGSEQSVTGYTTDVGTKTISVKLNETGKDTAKGTNAGTYPHGPDGGGLHGHVPQLQQYQGRREGRLAQDRSDRR